MEIEDFKKLVKGFDEDSIDYDEPHFSMRCDENSITKKTVVKTVLNPSNLIRIVNDRPKVFKLYFRLSKKRELKIIIDLLKHKKINLRTVKVLDKKFKLGKISRRRRY